MMVDTSHPFTYRRPRVRIVHHNGVWTVGCSTAIGVFRCKSHEEANQHSLVAHAIVWAFRKLAVAGGRPVS